MLYKFDKYFDLEKIHTFDILIPSDQEATRFDFTTGMMRIYLPEVLESVLSFLIENSSQKGNHVQYFNLHFYF